MTGGGSSRIVVIGAGQAGAELTFALRQLGHEGAITLVGQESHEPYQRPPLSKALLKGAMTHKDVRVRASEAYDKADIELVLGDTAESIDRSAHEVHLTSGRVLAYDRLALTLGGRPRSLDLGDAAEAAATLYDLEDALTLQPRLRAGQRVAVIGGGFVGLEVAAAAAEAGAEVTVIEAAPMILQRACAPAVSEWFTALHRSHGVTVSTGTTVDLAQSGTDGSTALVLSDGSQVVADLVVAGIGQVPNDELARRAGLEVDSGIVVDAQARTSDPDIVAAGDCARQLHGFLGRVVRLESQQNASEQARLAARTLLDAPVAHATVPWFWSDQFDARLQMAGVALPTDQQILRGDPASGSFSVVFVDGDRLTAVQAVNRPRDFTAARKLLAGRAQIGPPEALTQDIPLTDLVITSVERKHEHHA